MAMQVEANAVNVTSYFKLWKKADNLPATGLTIADIDLYYTRAGAAQVAKVDATALAAATTAHTDNFGFETGNGNYRIDFPDAAFLYGAGVREVILTVVHADVYTADLRVTIGKTGYDALLVTTVATTPTTTTITPLRKPGDFNSLLNGVIVFRDADGDPSFRSITAWDGTTITYNSVADFTVAVGDHFEVYPASVAATVIQIRDAILDRVLNGNHDTAGTTGRLIQVLLGLSARTNNSDLNDLLGVTDSASQTLYKELFTTAITGGQVANSIVERIKTMDDADIPASQDAIQVVTDKFVFTVDNKVDSTVSTINGSAEAARNLGKIFQTGAASQTVQSATNSTVTLGTGETATNDIYKGCMIFIAVGTGAEQARLCTGYNSSTKVADITPDWVTNPVSGDTYALCWLATANVEAVASTVQTAGDLAALITTADTAIDVAVADLANGTDGLGALKTLIDAIKSETALIVADTGELQTDNIPGTLSTIEGKIDTADTVVDGIQTDLSNVTDGLGALKALIDTLDTVADAVKVVTDKFVFTSATRVDVNIEAINDDTGASIKLSAHALETLPVTFSAGGSTTTAVLDQVDGVGASATDDKYNGRILIFNNGTLNHEIAEITDYDGGTLTATISAVTAAPGATHTARMV